jgi:multiple sugar transport system permease protein
MWPLIVLSEEARYTLPVALANLSGEHVQDTELMMAGAVITVLPTILVFLALQRAYVRGVMMGGVKE